MIHDNKTGLFRVGGRGARPGKHRPDTFRHVNASYEDDGTFFLWDAHDSDCVKCLTNELFTIIDVDGYDIDVEPTEPLIGKGGIAILSLEVEETELIAVSPLELLAREGA